MLAATGLLGNKSATTHWLAANKFAQRYPKVKVESEAIFTRDDNIYTSAGVTTGIDLALAIVEEDFGRVFKSETGLTPNKYLELLRLDLAKEMISQVATPGKL